MGASALPQVSACVMAGEACVVPLRDGAPEVGEVQGVLPDSSKSGLQAQMPNLDVRLYRPLLGTFSLPSLEALRARTA